MAAVLPVVPLDGRSRRRGRVDRNGARARGAGRGAVGPRRPRLARLRGRAARPATIEAVQTANASLPLTLLVALMWRYRDHALPAGLVLGYGIAVKLFLWPIAVRLALVGRAAPPRRRRGAGSSLLLLLPVHRDRRSTCASSAARGHFRAQTSTPFALLTDSACRTPRRGPSRSRCASASSHWLAPAQSRPRDRGRTRALADRVAPFLRAPARPARALASTVRRGVARFPSGSGSATARSTARHGRPPASSRSSRSRSRSASCGPGRARRDPSPARPTHSD